MGLGFGDFGFRDLGVHGLGLGFGVYGCRGLHRGLTDFGVTVPKAPCTFIVDT